MPKSGPKVPFNTFFFKVTFFTIIQKVNQIFGQHLQDNWSPRTLKSPNRVTLTGSNKLTFQSESELNHKWAATYCSIIIVVVSFMESHVRGKIQKERESGCM